MPNRIAITNENQRDAEVFAIPPAAKPAPRFKDPDGNDIKTKRFVKTTEECSYASLLRQYGGHDLAVEAMLAGDPEIDLVNTGRILGRTNRVFVRQDGSLLHSTHFLEVITDPAGQEVERKDFVDVKASVDEENPVRYTGKLFPKEKVLSSFALVRALQLRHVNGLTYDFLHGIAKTLHDSGKMLFVTASRGGPLILQRNGKPYRGFLEGRVDGDQYRLVLFLSNLELKKP